MYDYFVLDLFYRKKFSQKIMFLHKQISTYLTSVINDGFARVGNIRSSVESYSFDIATGRKTYDVNN